MTEWAPAKIKSQHLDRKAVIYVRQSHPQQQIRHPESLRCQLNLRQRILQWGWPEDRIVVLDGDQGKSGTTTVGRDDFAWLIREVALNHVGLVAGFQINRLAREDETVCRLIKSCILFDTLVADVDGIYHPQDYNDRLVLTIKGLVGGLELHNIQQRMQQARLERAKRGEWLGRPPRGFVIGENKKLVFDPDEQVQQAIRLLLAQFARQGSLSALLRYCQENNLRLPYREGSGAAWEKLLWRPPHRESLRNLLTHPAYAGAYTWGRRPVDPRRALEGRRGTGRMAVPAEQCQVFLRDNHAAYLSWECFQRNGQRLASQRQRGPQPSPQREVVSLLAGRVFCGRCGEKMQTQYTPRLRYCCARRALDYGEPACGSWSGEEVETLLAEQVLLALQPASLQLSLASVQRLEAERGERAQHWKLRLERAEQEVHRAFRQYDAVEPENRLVARSLERNWEEKLHARRALQEEYDRFCASQPTKLSPSQRQAILELSGNIPQLWESASVSEKRHLVQLVLEKAVVRGSPTERLGVELHWMGGSVTQHEVIRQVRNWSQLSTYDAIVKHMEELASQGAKSEEIASSLNTKGYRTCRGTEFTAVNIRQLRSRKTSTKTNKKGK